MTDTKRQLRALFFTRFANAYGLVTLLTLLSTYIELLGATGLVAGMFVTGLTLAQAVAVLPVAYLGDRFDKRFILLVGLGLATTAYAAFPFIETSLGFILVRGLQGIAATTAGLLALALVGELARDDGRGNTIGVSNAWRFAASIGGAMSAGVLYDAFGFGAVFGVLMVITAGAFVAVWRWVEPDETTVEGFAFSDMALNRRILTITSFRAQYAVAVTLVRTWVPIFAGVSVARGGLGFTAEGNAAAAGATAVAVIVSAEKFTNMLSQPYMGGLSDRFGRARFVFLGGLFYGAVAIVVPFTPAIGTALGLPAVFPFFGDLSTAFIPLLVVTGLLGVADSIREPASMALFADEGTGSGVAASFGVRDLVWRPGSILAPLAGGWLMTNAGMEWVFYLGAAAAFTGVFAFLGILSYDHGRAGLTKW
ncbi:Major Facilitator Superfamily protein [Halomicrobium zhouii]|uniref:Major Facilitator Superfamily protein n=1 Tax=Halomicrobium zhouii TaxID=767519 RepID=A0A1I6K2B7_9EURY|nr:MFS transporter [Halomicrobium zhouii]SFR85228.1 Major Facilitator Superfamily protein [Halomicrobium zhouii]